MFRRKPTSNRTNYYRKVYTSIYYKSASTLLNFMLGAARTSKHNCSGTPLVGEKFWESERSELEN